MNPADDRRPEAPGAGQGGARAPQPAGPRIRRSSGARRAPTPLPDGHRIGEAIPPMWEIVSRAFQPWKRELTTRWTTIVGEPCASHARPGLMEGPDGRTLIVFVDSSVWQYEIERRLRDLKDRIRKAIPAAPVDRVIFRQDPGLSPPPADREGD